MESKERDWKSGKRELENKEKWRVRKEIKRAVNGEIEKKEKWRVRKEIKRAGNREIEKKKNGV